jgi:hypothetical protein
VVPIESLYYTGDPEPLAPPLAQPQFAPPAPLGPLELVSHGEHLCQSADLIARSRSSTERDLRLYHLLGTLRSAGIPGPDPVAGALMVFARSTREALAAGVAARSTPALVSCLREAGELLRAVADADDRMLISRRILDAAYRLDGLRLAEAAPPAPPPVVPIESLFYAEPAAPAASAAPSALAAEPELPVVPIESLAPHEAPVVPIESLAPDETAVVPIESLAPSGGLEGSFRTFERLRRERPSTPATLEALVNAPSRVAAADAPDAAAETVTVDIGALCYRGRGALERAALVRQQLAEALTKDGGMASIQPLLQELLDLVPLALAES